MSLRLILYLLLEALKPSQRSLMELKRIPKVDKIVGPGNIYVATAKRHVFGQVGIDMIAGPSEILIICDGTTNPDWIAMDLFSQAEHDEECSGNPSLSRRSLYQSG